MDYEIRTREDWDDTQRAFDRGAISAREYDRRMSKGGGCCRAALPTRIDYYVKQEYERARRRKKTTRRTTRREAKTMPLLIHYKCYRDFKSAVKGVMKWKHLRGKAGQKRARAYTATTMRMQEQDKDRQKVVARLCGASRGHGTTWEPRYKRKAAMRKRAKATKRTAMRRVCRKWGRSHGKRVCRKWSKPVARRHAPRGRWTKREKAKHRRFDTAASQIKRIFDALKYGGPALRRGWNKVKSPSGRHSIRVYKHGSKRRSPRRGTSAASRRGSRRVLRSR